MEKAFIISAAAIMLMSCSDGDSSSPAKSSTRCLTFTCMPDEHVEVEGQRIPGYMFVSEQSVEFKQIAGNGGVGVGGGTPSPETVNENGQKKAEKAKAEQDRGENSWFKAAFNSFQNLIKMIRPGESLGLETGIEATEGPNGEKTIKANLCLQYARGSHNKDTCTKTNLIKRKDGLYYIEIKKLIAVQNIRKQWRLVYSTNNTISFLVKDPQEALNVFRSIDPTL